MKQKTVPSRRILQGLYSSKRIAFLLFLAALFLGLANVFFAQAAIGAEIAAKKVEIIPGWFENVGWGVVFALVFLFLGIIIVRLRLQRKNRELLAVNEKLKSAEEKYRQMVEDSPDLHYRIDREGKISYVSHAVRKLSGYTVEEALGMQMADFYINSEKREKLLSALEKDGYVNDFIAQLKRKDGSTWWASENVQVYKDSHGTILGFKGITRDVTERIKAEKNLKENYSIINQSLAITFLWKNETDWPVQCVSENLVDVFGYTAEEFLSGVISYADIIHPDDFQRVSEEVATHSEGEKTNRFNQEYRIITKGGTTIWIDDRTLIRRNKHGEITH